MKQSITTPAAETAFTTIGEISIKAGAFGYDQMCILLGDHPFANTSIDSTNAMKRRHKHP